MEQIFKFFREYKNVFAAFFPAFLILLGVTILFCPTSSVSIIHSLREMNKALDSLDAPQTKRERLIKDIALLSSINHTHPLFAPLFQGRQIQTLLILGKEKDASEIFSSMQKRLKKDQLFGFEAFTENTFRIVSGNLETALKKDQALIDKLAMRLEGPAEDIRLWVWAQIRKGFLLEQKSKEDPQAFVEMQEVWKSLLKESQNPELIIAIDEIADMLSFGPLSFKDYIREMSRKKYSINVQNI